MIELRTLGTVDLVDGEGARIDALLRRPKRLALLAYLAAGRPDLTYRREKLLSMFWPENDEVRGRGSLRQSVHVLRQILGSGSLLAVGDEELGLAPGIVRCDAVEFERIIRDGRFEEALSMYGGDFLPGFFLDDAAEFDEWLEATRTRLRGHAAHAATSLAEAALTKGDFAECIQRSRQALAIGPGDERATRCLISALDRSGNRGSAIAAYEVLAKRLHADFAVLPSAETQAVVGAVRAREAPRLPKVRVVPPEVRISPAPTRAPATHVWAYAGTAIRSALVITVLLLSGSRSRATAPVETVVVPREARDAYDRARFYLTKPTEENLRRAVLLFEHALDVEPLYSQAYAGLGDAYLRLGYGSYIAPVDAFPKALAAARRAVELDSLAPEPHVTLAFARMYYEWDFAGAEQEFKRAMRLAPNYALAHAWYAYLLTAEGHVEAARREVQLARRLAPLSVAFAVDAGFVSFYGDSLTDARRELDEALLMAPEVPAAHLWLGRLAQREGDFKRARAEYQASGALRNWVPTIAGAGCVDAQLGDSAGARLTLVHLDSLAKRTYVTPYAVALVHAALGETDQAFHWLDRAVAERAHWLVWLNRDSRWSPVRNDPRFAAIVRRVGIPN